MFGECKWIGRMGRYLWRVSVSKGCVGAGIYVLRWYGSDLYLRIEKLSTKVSSNILSKISKSESKDESVLGAGLEEYAAKIGLWV